MAMEMGVGLQVFQLGQEEADPMVRKTMCEVVEDKMHAQMSVPEKMQMQRQQGEGRIARRVGE